MISKKRNFENATYLNINHFEFFKSRKKQLFYVYLVDFVIKKKYFLIIKKYIQFPFRYQQNFSRKCDLQIIKIKQQVKEGKLINQNSGSSIQYKESQIPNESHILLPLGDENLNTKLAEYTSITLT